jgi:peptidoglycan/xylan/chitin deacetylase (PgdA/CDA1 family)
MYSKSLFLSALLASSAVARPGRTAAKKRAPSGYAFGQIISSCTVPGTVALAFDDGPYVYTDHVLDVLDAGGHTSTFFMNGYDDAEARLTT